MKHGRKKLIDSVDLAHFSKYAECEARAQAHAKTKPWGSWDFDGRIENGALHVQTRKSAVHQFTRLHVLGDKNSWDDFWHLRVPRQKRLF